MQSYQYRESHCRDKTILRPPYLHSGISYTGKMTALYWSRALVTQVHVIDTPINKDEVFQRSPMLVWTGLPCDVVLHFYEKYQLNNIFLCLTFSVWSLFCFVFNRALDNWEICGRLFEVKGNVLKALSWLWVWGWPLERMFLQQSFCWK